MMVLCAGSLERLGELEGGRYSRGSVTAIVTIGHDPREELSDLRVAPERTTVRE